MSKQINSFDILVQLERLAASFPWDYVDLWTRRWPEGNIEFTAYVAPSEKMGMNNSVFGHGKTAETAVNDAIKQAGSRDPEELRRKAITELKEKIAKLESMEFGLPPYIPNRELAEFVKAPIDV